MKVPVDAANLRSRRDEYWAPGLLSDLSRVIAPNGFTDHWADPQTFVLDNHSRSLVSASLIGELSAVAAKSRTLRALKRLRLEVPEEVSDD
jgi:hypothetical protein